MSLHLSFDHSLLHAGSTAETFMLVQCASPGRGGEWVGVCALCRVEEGLSRREQLVRCASCRCVLILLSAPTVGVTYCLAVPAWTGACSVPTLTSTSSAPGHMTDTSVHHHHHYHLSRERTASGQCTMKFKNKQNYK